MDAKTIIGKRCGVYRMRSGLAGTSVTARNKGNTGAAIKSRPHSLIWR